jgi:hypothetical protein
MKATPVYSIHKILWHVDPLLGNDREIRNVQQPFLSNGPANRHELNNSTARISLQQSDVFYASVLRC